MSTPTRTDRPRRTSARLTAAVLAAGAWLVPGAAGQSELESFCATLVDHPGLASGDRDAAVLALLERVVAEPSHPLAEAALVLLDATRADVADPAAWRVRVRALDPDAAWRPGALRLVERLRGRAACHDLAAGERLGADAFPSVLSSWRVLGPLGSSVDPRRLGDDPRWFMDSWDGLVSGRQLEPPRTTTRPFERAFADPVGEVPGRDGWVLLETAFDAPGGGAAFVEWDLGVASPAQFDTRPDPVLPLGGASFPSPAELDPASRRFVWSLHGAAPQLVDRLVARSDLVRRPVTLRDGLNVLRMGVEAGAQLPLCVRVLDADGRPWPGLTHRVDMDALPDPLPDLGAVPPAPRPTSALPRAEDPLGGAASAGPSATAWRGLLGVLDRRPLEGLQDIEFAAASGSASLMALAAQVAGESEALPQRERRSRSREWLERARAADPGHLAVGIAWARLTAAEDRDAEALADLAALADAHPDQPWSLLFEAALATRAGLLARADASLDAALSRAPRSPAALDARATAWESAGFPRRALDLRTASLAAAGTSGRRLEQLAGAHAGLGDVTRAAQLWDAALQRDPDAARRLRHAAWALAVAPDPARLRPELVALTARYPGWDAALELLVRCEQLSGDADREREALTALLRARPSHVEARRRLPAVAGRDAVADFFAAHALATDDVLARYVPADWSGSIISVLDDAQVWIHADGAVHTRTHEIHHLRDHDACARMGELRLPGEVDVVRVLKADGAVYEPRIVQGSWVLPRLEPGDFVETVVQTRSLPPDDGLPRPGRWMLQSTARPFVTTRWTVSAPRELELQVALSDGAGATFVAERFTGALPPGALSDLQQRVDEDGSRVVRSWRRDGVERRSRQPLPPVDAALLPWVDVGAGLHEDVLLARSARELEGFLQTAPPLAAVVGQLGLGEQRAAAARLLAFVHDTVESVSARPVGALDTLLSREGRPELLYAALLREAGIAHELVWARDVAPVVDPEPEPTWLRPEWLQRRLLVRVLPEGGGADWCDPGTLGLPYGTLRASAPGAPGLALEWTPDGRPEALEVARGLPRSDGASGRLAPSEPHPAWRTLPDQPPTTRELNGTLVVEPDGAARFDGILALHGAGGWRMARVLERAEERRRQTWIREQIAELVPGVQLRNYGITLADPARPAPADGEVQAPPLEVRLGGRVPGLVDLGAPEPALELPLASLRLAARLSSDGPRRLALVSPERGVEKVRLVIELPAGLALAPESATEAGTAVLDHGGWSHTLRARSGERDQLIVAREFAQEPFRLEIAEVPALQAWAAEVDARESRRLQLIRR